MTRLVHLICPVSRPQYPKMTEIMERSVIQLKNPKFRSHGRKNRKKNRS